jgi:uncharacterized protein YecT (DUF1311 family)
MAVKPLKLLHPMSAENRMILSFLVTLFICASVVRAQEVNEVGSGCTAKSELPQSFLCIEGFVVDCRSSTSSRERLYCVSDDLKKADDGLNRLYQRTLKKLEKPNDEYADYSNARRGLIEGQRAWVRFKKLDCDVPGYLNLKGSTQSNEVVACELRHTKNRIADLNAYLIPQR